MEFKIWMLPNVEFSEWNSSRGCHVFSEENVLVLYWETDKNNDINAFLLRSSGKRVKKTFYQSWFLRNIKEVTVEVKEDIIHPVVQNGPYR